MISMVSLWAVDFDAIHLIPLTCGYASTFLRGALLSSGPCGIHQTAVFALLCHDYLQLNLNIAYVLTYVRIT